MSFAFKDAAWLKSFAFSLFFCMQGSWYCGTFVRPQGICAGHKNRVIAPTWSQGRGQGDQEESSSTALD